MPSTGPRSHGSGALGFFGSGFPAARSGDLRLVLIQGVARMQGAALVPNADGLILHWPVDGRAPAGGAPADRLAQADAPAPSSVQ